MNNQTKIRPVIKWSGSKRSQAAEIVKLFPSFQKYYEPFIGGASVAYMAKPRNGICGDICVPLINLWNIIKLKPESLSLSYHEAWHRLQKAGHQVYYEIRDHFNQTQSPYDLFFLSRTCVNGLIRFNKNGEFNNSLHHTRKGIHPLTLNKILLDWSARMKNIEFRTGDYRATTMDITKHDFIYLDPPYFNTKGRYYGTIDYEEFLSYLEALNSKGIKYALSFDGIREETDYTIDLPKELYKKHIMLEAGNSSFKKVMDKRTEKVCESLYLNW
ncbi:MAG: hypothetical protein H6Q65_1255 [Firmicutes bacterium]|nr:hypothetical protein [Bacillota bacterium]